MAGFRLSPEQDPTTRRRRSNCRSEMQAAGATHLLHTSPMYNKPPQRGIVAHFRAIADAVQLPIVVYNVPGRTGSNVEAATTLELAEHDNIVAVKEASGNLAQIGEIIRNRPAGFTVLSGDDALTVPVMADGGDGVISVTSNVAPRLVSQLAECLRARRLRCRRATSLIVCAMDGCGIRRVESRFRPRQRWR